MFVPTDANCPLRLKYLDVQRYTQTDFDHASENKIEDVWTENDPERVLSSSWIGTTTFQILRPAPAVGFEWEGGRLTRVQTTTRSPNI